MPDVEFLLNAPGDPAPLIEVARVGQYKDPRYGDFSITKADFNKWIKNFRELSIGDGRLGLPIDRDHSPEKTGDTEAVGWIKDLVIDGDRLMGRPEWNQLGRELVEQKRYAYISPSYQRNFKDPQGRSHGTALVGVALTNRPFLRMATVNLSQMDPEEFDRLLAASDSDGDTDVNDGTENDPTDLDDLMLSILPRAVAAGHITQGESDRIQARVSKAKASKHLSDDDTYSHRQMPDFTAIAKALNLSEDADEATILAALPQPPAEGTVTLAQEQVDTLLADAAAGRQAAKDLASMKFENAFTLAAEGGRVVAGQKETFEAIYETNPEHCLKLLSELPQAVNMEPQGSGHDPAVPAELATLSADFQDTAAAPMPIDQDALRLHAAAEAIALERNVPYERALVLAESGVGV